MSAIATVSLGNPTAAANLGPIQLQLVDASNNNVVETQSINDDGTSTTQSFTFTPAPGTYFIRAFRALQGGVTVVGSVVASAQFTIVAPTVNVTVPQTVTVTVQ